MHLLARANKRNHKSTKTGMTCRECVLGTTFDIDMSPKIKICNEFKDFLPLDVLLPLIAWDTGEDREQKIRAQRK